MYHEKLNIPKVNDEYMYGKNDLFSLVLILKHMLREEEFRLLMSELSYEIDILTGKLQTITISKVLEEMGFLIILKKYQIYRSSNMKNKNLLKYFIIIIISIMVGAFGLYYGIQKFDLFSNTVINKQKKK